MTEPICADKQALLKTFDVVFNQISSKGYKHNFTPDDALYGIHAHRISTVAALKPSEENRQLALIDKGGAVRPFAKVNGKGYVEAAGGVSEQHMAVLLIKTGDRMARTVPCRPDEGMYHYSCLGTFKVF